MVLLVLLFLSGRSWRFNRFPRHPWRAVRVDGRDSVGDVLVGASQGIAWTPGAHCPYG